MRRPPAIRVGLFMAVVAASTGCTNFHEVDPGRLYRSAQLSGPQLEQVIKAHNIRTVIHLRGRNDKQPWYRTQQQVTQRLGVEQIDIPMSAQSLPKRENVLKLLEAFDRARRPMLIHCRAGADRTGEAVALYRIDQMKQTKEQALEALTPRTLHFEIFHPPKRAFIRMYRGREWLRDHYDPNQPPGPQPDGSTN